jgi:hypothetical protein
LVGRAALFGSLTNYRAKPFHFVAELYRAPVHKRDKVVAGILREMMLIRCAQGEN